MNQIGSTPNCEQERKVLLNLNESAYGMLPQVEQSILDTVNNLERYQFGLIETFRQTLSQEYDVPVDWVALHPGSNRALHYATQAFTSASVPLIMASPGYPVCEQVAIHEKRPIYKVPLCADGRHDLQAMRELAEREGGLIYIANPNNPTGSVTPADDILTLLDTLPEKTKVLVDEAYIEYSDQPSLIDQVRHYPALIVTRTFSKIFAMAGLRLGYAIAQPDTLHAVHTMPANDVSVPAVVAALAGMQQADQVRERKAMVASERETLVQWLNDHDIECFSSEANCLMFRITEGAEAVKGLAALGVIVGRVWPDMPDWIRVTIGTQEEMTALRQALETVLYARF